MLDTVAALDLFHRDAVPEEAAEDQTQQYPETDEAPCAFFPQP